MGEAWEGVTGIDWVLPRRLDGVDGPADILDPKDSCLCTDSNLCLSFEGESSTEPELCDFPSILAARGLAREVPPGDTAANNLAKSRGEDEVGVVGSAGRTDLGGVDGI